MSTRLLFPVAILSMLVLSTPALAVPANDTCEAPTVVLSMPFSDNLNTSSATSDPGDPTQSLSPCKTPGTNSNSVWYQFTPAFTGTLELSTTGSNYDTVLSVHTGTCGALTEQACADDSVGNLATASVPVTAATTYFIEVTDFGPPGGGSLRFSMSLSVPVTNDICTDAKVISSAPYSDTAEIGSATGSGDPAQSCGSGLASPGVWYTFTPAAPGNVTIDTEGSSFDTVLSVYKANCLTVENSANEVACNDDSNGPTSRVTFPVMAAATYLIQVASYGSTAGTLQIQVSADLCGDTIIGAFEQCDDGNTTPCDGCSSTCQIDAPGYVCGDDTFNALCEQCDDGNAVAGDGCSEACALESEALRCQLAIAKAARNYVRGTLQALQKCQAQRDKGALVVASCINESKTQGSIASAQLKVRKTIEKDCTSNMLPALGACADSLDSLVSVDGNSGCLITGHRAAIDKMIFDQFGQ